MVAARLIDLTPWISTTGSAIWSTFICLFDVKGGKTQEMKQEVQNKGKDRFETLLQYSQIWVYSKLSLHRTTDTFGPSTHTIDATALKLSTDIVHTLVVL